MEHTIFDFVKNSLSDDAISNILTHVVSQKNGTEVYDVVFNISSIENSKIYFDRNSKVNGSWYSMPSSMSSKWNNRITWTGKNSYENTVENIQSSVISHEWYSHIVKGQGNYAYLSSHRLAYKNVINNKSLWNNTTDAYKSFYMRTLLEYTKSETARNQVDQLYRNLYDTYKDK